MAKSASKPLYFVTWKTEGSDEGVEGYFSKKPSEGELTALFKKTMPHEFYDDGAGGEERMVRWEVHKLTEKNLPKPVKPVPGI